MEWEIRQKEDEINFIRGEMEKGYHHFIFHFTPTAFSFIDLNPVTLSTSGGSPLHHGTRDAPREFPCDDGRNLCQRMKESEELVCGNGEGEGNEWFD